MEDNTAPQSENPQIAGKLVVLALARDDEREAFSALFTDMKLQVKHATTAKEAQRLLEDFPTDLLIMDIQLPDMHGFQLVGRLREIEGLRKLPIMAISDQPVITPSVANFESLTRPVSIARVRQNILKTLAKDPAS